MTMHQHTDVTAVEDLDLDRYLGRWYEIARLPLRFEDDAATNVTAHYSLEPDGSVRVDNRCLDAHGEPTQALGRGTVGDSPAHLKVTFLPPALRWIPFTEADYWVLKIDADYQHALVGTPDRKFLWVLARTPTIEDATERELLAEAARQGFDLSSLVRAEQDGGTVTDDQLQE